MNPKLSTTFLKAIREGDIKIVRACLAEGADPNTRDQYNLTALMWSARRGHFDVFSALVKAGPTLWPPIVQ